MYLNLMIIPNVFGFKAIFTSNAATFPKVRTSDKNQRISSGNILELALENPLSKVWLKQLKFVAI